MKASVGKYKLNNTWTQMALLFKHFSFEFNHMFWNFVQYFVL